MHDWLIEFNNGVLVAVRSDTKQGAIVEALKYLKKASRVKDIHAIN